MREQTYRRLLFLLLSGIVCLIYGSVKFDWGEGYNAGTRASTKPIEQGTGWAGGVAPSSAMKSEVYEEYVYPSGEPIGIYVKTEGVMVIGVAAVEQENGHRVVPCEGKLRQGDYILALNGTPISSKREMIDVLQTCRNNIITIRARRDGGEFEVKVQAVKNVQDRYLLGLWVKDDISGIGTLTYVTKNSFGALGHSINDNDTGALFSISDGAIYRAEILHIRKPAKGTPGRLEGLIDYSGGNIIGRVEGNRTSGIQGYLTESARKQYANEQEKVPIAKREDIHEGDAYIVSALTGERIYYEISIVSVDWSENDAKGLEIRVTDEELLSITGGIVQGMSGSPIVQDGKLIGAVTHVFVNDASKGYGIYIGDMIE